MDQLSYALGLVAMAMALGALLQINKLRRDIRELRTDIADIKRQK